MSPVELHLDLLGPFRLRSADGTGLSLPKKAQALLAFLAVNRDQPIARDRLRGLLWDYSGPEQAGHSLRQCLLSIRRALGAHASEILSGDSQCVTLKSGQLLSIDLDRFEALCRARSVEELAQASELYRDEFLSNLNIASEPFDAWLTIERARLFSIASDLLHKFADMQARSGSPDQAIACAQRLVSLDPLREGGHRLLMSLYAASSRRGDALRQYAACKDLLQRELGTAPEDETTRLAETLRRREDVTPPQEAIRIEAAPNAKAQSATMQDIPTDARSDFAIAPMQESADLPETVAAQEAVAPELFPNRGELGASKPVTPNWRAGIGHAVRATVRSPVLAWSVAGLCFGFAILSGTVAHVDGTGQSQLDRQIAARLDTLVFTISQNSNDNHNSLRQIQQLVVDLDDKDVEAKLNLAMSLSTGALNQWTSDEAGDLNKAEHLLADAQKLAPGIGRLQAARCQLLRAERHYQDAVRLCREVLQSFPKSAFLAKELGYDEMAIGRNDEALREFLLADQLEPSASYRWAWYTGIGRIYMMQERDQEAVEWLRRARDDAPTVPRTLAYLAAAYALADMKDEASSTVARLMKLSPGMTIKILEGHTVHSILGPGVERVIKGLQLAGMPE